MRRRLPRQAGRRLRPQDGRGGGGAGGGHAQGGGAAAAAAAAVALADVEEEEEDEDHETPYKDTLFKCRLGLIMPLSRVYVCDAQPMLPSVQSGP